jgi:hypothetical protein
MVDFTDANRVALWYALETSWGETPASTAMTELRFTSESLAHTKQTIVSQEIRADRMRADVVEVAAAAGGDINYELSATTYEALFQAALGGTLVSTARTAVSATFTASTITVADGLTGGFVAGQWVKVVAASASVSTIAQIVTATSTVLSFAATTFGAATGTHAATSIRGRMLRTGTTKRSFFVQKQYTDQTGEYMQFTGMRLGSMSMNVASQQIVTGTFMFQGKGGFYASTSFASVTVSATTTDVINATANVGNILVGGTSLGTAIQSINYTLNNNLRTQQGIGSKYAQGVGLGGIDITGTVTCYFLNSQQYQKMINHESVTLTFKFTDSSANVIVVTFPKIYWTGGNPNAGGIDQDVMLPLGFTAARDPTTSCMMQIDYL